MGTIQKENLNILVKELSESHIRFVGYAKQARLELKKNIARLFEALSFSKQVQALLLLNHSGCIGKTNENLSVLTGDSDLCNYDRVDGSLNLEEVAALFDETEEKNSHLYVCAKDATEARMDMNIGNINVCSRCGYVVVSDEPGECTVCHSPSGYFRLF